LPANKIGLCVRHSLIGIWHVVCAKHHNAHRHRKKPLISLVEIGASTGKTANFDELSNCCEWGPVIYANFPLPFSNCSRLDALHIPNISEPVGIISNTCARPTFQAPNSVRYSVSAWPPSAGVLGIPPIPASFSTSVQDVLGVLVCSYQAAHQQQRPHMCRVRELLPQSTFVPEVLSVLGAPALSVSPSIGVPSVIDVPAYRPERRTNCRHNRKWT